jgi:hypothetical protein
MPVLRLRAAALASFLVVLAVVSCAAVAAPRTVCTITINSPDEKEIFERYLPPGDYRFVELVERGRSDWFSRACQRDIRCDALIISGHFDGGTEFYTDRLDQREFLPVTELEQASCSASCPAVFSSLKEVYLFGCKTLNPEPMRSASPEMTRSLIREGVSLAEAERRVKSLAERYGESNRDRMRVIFQNVPVLYGFSSKAPLGATARPLLERLLQSSPSADIASGRPNEKLVALFAPASMTVASGVTDDDPQSGFRRDMCQFADERLTDARKVEFVHRVLHRDMAEVRLFLDHLERYMAMVAEPGQRSTEATIALAAITADAATRERYLAFARDVDDPAARTRMLELATRFGWLSTAEARAELLQRVADGIARDTVGAADVELVCTRAREWESLPALPAFPARPAKTAHAAILACLGNAEARLRVLRSLGSAHDDDVAIAQIYFKHHPTMEPVELRALTADIVRMRDSEAQLRALELLARQRLSDPESLLELARLYRLARSVALQRAIAGVLILGDYAVLERADVARALRAYRLKPSDGADVIDALLRRIEPSRS